MRCKVSINGGVFAEKPFEVINVTIPEGSWVRAEVFQDD